MKTVFLSLFSCVGFAQTPAPDANPAFDVADVHVSRPGTKPLRGLQMPAGRSEFHAVTVLSLIEAAYGVGDDRVIGGPAWLDADKFDIYAKAPVAADRETRKLMLRALLADRFKLTLHLEDRPLPAFTLSLGKKLLMKPAADPGGEPHCEAGDVGGNSTTLACRNVPGPKVAETLGQRAQGYLTNRPVVDRTGLKGSYDFTLHWTWPAWLKVVPDGISFFDAIEKNLGLKLEAATLPTPCYVIDSASETPTPNAPGVKENLPSVTTEFEVVTIKQSAPGTELRARLLPSGLMEWRAMTLQRFIWMAWEKGPERILGGPKWLDSDKWDVEAIAGKDVGIDGVRVMVRAMLKERFGLELHTEERPLPVYALNAKRANKLEKADGLRSICNRSVESGLIVYTCTNTTMAELVEKLPTVAGAFQYLDHSVVDATELEGRYNFAFGWTPKQNLPRSASQTPPGAAPAAADPGGVTLFEGLEKIGLKLEQQKRPMQVVVVDHINQTPTAN